jgi:hypothetical protein
MAARFLALSAAMALGGCTEEPADDPVDSVPDSALAGLLADGVLPDSMQPMAPMPPPLPPRFCGGGGFPPPGDDAGVAEPPSPGLGAAGMPASGPKPPQLPGRLPGMVAAGSTSAADAGTDAPAAGPDVTCASVPIGFWKFDDCNPFRTDLSDSSFQGHNAFRTVDLACAPGQEGQAVSFARAEDLVYVPDQPGFGLEHGMTVAAWVRPETVDRVQTIFRKRDDANSAFALVINSGRFQVVVRLASGRLASVSARARAARWTHVAASYDGSYLRLYINGQEAGRTEASGSIARGVGPLLMGNDAAERRFQGLMDNAWFNTMAAPADAIMQLTCLRSDLLASVSPTLSPTVAPGTAVTYTLSLTNPNDANCAPISAFTNVQLPQQDFTSEPSFLDVPPIPSGERATFEFAIASSTETEAGSYQVRFQTFANEGGVFGPGPFGVPGVSIAGGPFGSFARPSPAPLPDPAAPVFTGQAEAVAEYVVEEPSGCHVSSQRTLMIRAVGVVDDPIRTSLDGDAEDPRTGAWTFGRLMERLSPTDSDAPDVTEAMFRSFLSTQTINGFAVTPRAAMDPVVLQPWPRSADGKLDLARAPLRLLAITSRLDLQDLENGKAGEGRLVYGVLDETGNPLEFTVIFEYLLPAKNVAEAREWADAFHGLQALPFPSEAYNDALQAITDAFTARDAIPSRPNGSALIDIRTNEIALDFQWELREFHISPVSGFMDVATVFITPDASFNFSERLARWINANEASILTETHIIPDFFEDAPFLAGAVFNNIDAWDAPGITNPEARHKFSLNTCNGCHGGETQTSFLHVNPRLPGEQSALSAFMTGETVFDPFTGVERRLNELARRRQLLERVVCAPGAP